MKLNHNCVRDVLIFCEDFLLFGEDLSWQPLSLDDFCNGLPQYSREDIAYTILILEEATLIVGSTDKYCGGIYDVTIYRLTYNGHEFVDAIRPESVWKKVQTVLNTIGSSSIPIIQSLASQFTLDFLKKL